MAQSPPPTTTRTTSQVIDAAIETRRHLGGALLPILHAIQDDLGFVPEEAVPRLAQALNLSQAEVHGVISFYHDFRQSPPGRHVLKLCRAEACQAMGSDALAARVQERTGIGQHGTTADGGLTVEPVYCLGNCACAPSAQLDGKVRGRLTAERFDALLDGVLGSAPDKGGRGR
ncbi:MAG: formate dehydrogenase subunit gamma [Planctomycetota bacterium]